MKKESAIVSEAITYETMNTLKNTTLVRNDRREVGLIDNNTGEFIIEFGDYEKAFTVSDNAFAFVNTITNKNTNVKTSVEYVTIYDVNEGKIVVEDFILIHNNHDGCLALQNPKNNKYLFYNATKKWSSNKEVKFLEEELYDNIQYLHNRDSYTSFYLVEKYNRIGVYEVYERKLEIPIKYTDARKLNKENYYVFIKDDKEYLNSSNMYIYDIPFKNISADVNDTNIIYCQDESYILILDESPNRHVFSSDLLNVPVYENIEFTQKISSYNPEFIEYQFIIKENGLYGIISLIARDNKRPYILIKRIEAIYENIEFNKNNNTYTLINNGKKDLFRCENDKVIQTKKGYENVTNIEGHLYLLEGKIENDIALLDFKNHLIRENINELKYEDNSKEKALLYKSDTEKGLILLGPNKYSSAHYCYNVFENVDSFSTINIDDQIYYKIVCNELKGIIYNNEILISAEYENIEIMKLYNQVLFSLKKGSQYELVKSKKGKKESIGVFQNIRFFKNIYVLYDESNVYIYNRSDKLINKYPANTIVEEIDDRVLINGEVYLYDYGNLYKHNPVYRELYVTVYSTIYGDVVVNSLNKNTHDDICADIESMSEDEVNNRLIELNEKHFKTNTLTLGKRNLK